MTLTLIDLPLSRNVRIQRMQANQFLTRMIIYTLLLLFHVWAVYCAVCHGCVICRAIRSTWTRCCQNKFSLWLRQLIKHTLNIVFTSLLLKFFVIIFSCTMYFSSVKICRNLVQSSLVFKRKYALNPFKSQKYVRWSVFSYLFSSFELYFVFLTKCTNNDHLSYHMKSVYIWILRRI